MSLAGGGNSAGHVDENELPGMVVEIVSPQAMPVMLSNFSNAQTTPSESSRAPIRKSPSARRLMSFKQSAWVLSPHDEWVTKWDMLMLFPVLFITIVTPVEVCMLEVRIDALFAFNRLVDLMFLADMVLQFFLMYAVKTRFGEMLEYRHSKIVRHYLFGWFMIDFISILPFDLIGFFINSPGAARMKAMKAVRQLRLLKLLRAAKSSKVARKLEENMSVTYQSVHLAKCMMVLIVATHWIACTWSLNLQLVLEDEGIPRWVDSVTAYEEFPEVATTNSSTKLYLASAYFAAYTMTSVGLGDIAAKNVVERIVCVIIIFLAGLTWTYILGQVCTVVAAMNVHEQEFRQTMDDLNAMMRDLSLPFPMRRKLRRFILSTRGVQRHHRHNLLYAKMSPALQGEVAWLTNYIWIEKVSFLSDIKEDHKDFVIDIALALDINVFAQEETFGENGVLYIIHRGLVGRMMRVLRTGAVWGEDFVLLDHSMQENVQSFALTYVEVNTLKRDVFMAILAKQNALHPEINTKVRKFCVRTAVRRGILLAAEKRKGQRLHRSSWKFDNGEVSRLSKRPSLVYSSSARSQIQSSNEVEFLALQQEVEELKQAQQKSNALLKHLMEELQKR